MISRLQSPDPAAEEQAALWAARLDGSELTPQDQRELTAWLEQQPAHRALLSQYCQFSTDLEQALPALAAAGEMELPDVDAFRRARRGWRWGAGLLAGATAAAVAIFVWRGPRQTQSLRVATAMAQRQTLTLVDGSRIELNAQSSLQIDIGREKRQVRLVAGEAYFIVGHDPQRPFVVETPAGSMQVTGTRFDVRLDNPATLEVTVVEGTVQARPDDTRGQVGAVLTLTAGRQLRAAPGGLELRTLSATALQNVTAWREGKVVFVETPLGEALARFARYHGRRITVTPGAAELHLGGRFDLDDLDGFLATLEEVLPVRVVRDLHGTVQISLRSEQP